MPLTPSDTVFARRRYARDNYVYLIAKGNDAALVDPGDAAVALDLARSHGLRPRFILHTHGHRDHTGGSAEVRAELGATVHGHGVDASWFQPDVDLAGIRDVELGSLELRVHHVPGHTPGSVLYEWCGKLLSGDTLYWGGSGNCKNGGDPALLARSFMETIAALDGSLEVDPGHDYAENNLSFALELEPENAAARGLLESARAARMAGLEPRATTLAEERQANPFLRAGTPAIMEALALRGEGGARDALEAFVALRRMKDAWQYKPSSGR